MLPILWCPKRQVDEVLNQVVKLQASQGFYELGAVNPSRVLSLGNKWDSSKTMRMDNRMEGMERGL